VRRWLTYDEAHADLSSLEPVDRVPVLLEVWRGETTTLEYEDLRRLFILAWADGASAREHDHEVLALLRWIQPVRDTEEHPVGDVTIYRQADNDARCIRWTLDLERVPGQSSSGTLRGTVAGRHVLAYLNAASEQHALVDPDEIRDVELL
jgi:hypothetical protein